MANEDEACMDVPDTECSERKELARRRKNMFIEEQNLAKMHYHWDSTIKVWWSDDSKSLPVLKDSEARALADEIIYFVIK